MKGEDAHSQYMHDLEDVLKTQHGRRLLWHIINKCGIYATTFSNNNSITCYREGARAVGLALARDAQGVPELYFKMLEECSGLQDYRIANAAGKMDEKGIFEDE